MRNAKQGNDLKRFVIYLDFPLNNHIAKTNRESAVRATTAQLYPGRDIFDFDQGHVIKKQPITVFILLSESLWKHQDSRENKTNCFLRDYTLSV